MVDLVKITRRLEGLLKVSSAKLRQFSAAMSLRFSIEEQVLTVHFSFPSITLRYKFLGYILKMKRAGNSGKEKTNSKEFFIL